MHTQGDRLMKQSSSEDSQSEKSRFCVDCGGFLDIEALDLRKRRGTMICLKCGARHFITWKKGEEDRMRLVYVESRHDINRVKYRKEFSRAGVDSLVSVSAFLGGLFFAVITLLVNQGGMFSELLFQVQLVEGLLIRVTRVFIIAIPLTFSSIVLMFSAIFLGFTATLPEPGWMDASARKASELFALGIISSVISLFVVLLLIDLLLSFVGITLTFGILFWWAHRKSWECNWCGFVHEKPEVVLLHELKVHGKHKQHEYFKLKEPSPSTQNDEDAKSDNKKEKIN